MTPPPRTIKEASQRNRAERLRQRARTGGGGMTLATPPFNSHEKTAMDKAYAVV
jgi:hypothetical protein